MTLALPFRGVRYRRAGHPELASLLTPAHHQVSELEVARLYLRHPHHAIRLERGQDEAGDHALFDRHVRAALTWDEWVADGVLGRDELPGYYVYTRETPAGTLRGLAALVSLAAPARPVVAAPPERVADRLALLRALRVQVGPVVALYQDPDQLLGEYLLELTSEIPMHEGLDLQGAKHALFRAFPGPEGPRLDEVLRAAPLALLDDAGRWAAARAYQAELELKGQAPGGQDWALVLLLDAEDPALELGVPPLSLWDDPPPVPTLPPIPGGFVHHDLAWSLPTP